MANPNRVVAAARNKKFSVVSVHPFNTESEADEFAKSAKAEGKRVRVTSYMIGRRGAGVRKYTARIYE